MIDQGKPRIFWGYIIVAAGFLAGMSIIGQSVLRGVFFKPILLELDLSRAVTSGATSISAVAMGVAAVFAGKLTDKYGPRLVLVIAALAVGLGNMLMSQVESLWQFYLFYGFLVGVGMGGADVPIATTVSRWFVRRRGMMIGITKVGAGVGIVLFPMLASFLMDNYGWREAYLYIGGIILVVILFAGFLFRRDPAQMNQLPDGDTMVPAIKETAQVVQYSARDAMSSRQFWTFVGVWAIFGGCVQAVLLHIVNHATDLGISTSIAASIVSVIGGLSILGRLTLAGLSDRIGPRSSYLIALAMLTSSMLWMQFARQVWMFYVFAVLYGTAHGACFTLLAPMLSKLFGLNSLGTIMGFVVLFGALGSLIGPVAAGWIFDVTGTYQLAFVVMFILCIISMLLMFSLKPTRTPLE